MFFVKHVLITGLYSPFPGFAFWPAFRVPVNYNNLSGCFVLLGYDFELLGKHAAV